MKIQNSEGQTIEVPRHLRKAVKKMLSNNQHDEISQIFGCGGMIDPITGGKPPLYGKGGKTDLRLPLNELREPQYENDGFKLQRELPQNLNLPGYQKTFQQTQNTNEEGIKSLIDRRYSYPLYRGDGYDDLYYDAGLSPNDSDYGAKYKQNKYSKEFGLGGTIGSLLSTAAPIASLIPGVGTAVGVGAGILGAGLQALDSSSGGSQGGSPQRGVPMQHMSNYAPTGFAEGGETGLVPINIEGHNVKNISMSQAKKGELLVHQGRVHKNYISRPPHPAEGQNPLGNDEVPQGLIVIPKDRSTEYLNANTGLRKQIERSIVSQQEARESRMMRKGGYTREKASGGILTGVAGTYDWTLSGGSGFNAQNPSVIQPSTFTPSTSYPDYGTEITGLQDGRSIMGNTTTPAAMSDFTKLNLGQAGLSMIPAISDIMDMTAAVQTPNYQTMRGITPDLIDPSTGQAQVNQAYRTGANSLRDSGVYSIKSNRNLVADRMYNSGTQAIDIANRNVGIKNQFKGINADINKFNVGISNQAEDIKMMGQAKRREARRNLLDRAPAATSQYMQNGLYAKMLGI